MEQRTICRIYCNFGDKKPNLTFWEKIWNSSLGSHIIKKAKANGIEQVISYYVTSGYLKGQAISVNAIEITPPNNPQCIELIDTEEKINSFLEETKILLKGTSLILLKNDVFRLKTD